MDLYDMFYAPRRRTVLFFESLDMIASDLSDKFTAQEIDQFFSARFREVLHWVSTGWRGLCSDPEWQAHYGQKVTHIGFTEMVRNIFKAYSDTKAHLLEKGMYSRTRQKIMYKCVCKALVRSAAKAILETLGVWQLLKAVKRRISSR